MVFFSLGAIKRNNDWQNPITLYSNILEYSPETARVHNNLAMEYFDQGMVNDAVAHYKLSISMSDLYPQSHYNLGNAYVSLGLIDEAVEEYKKAVEMDDNFVQPHKQLAAIYYSKEMYDEYQEEMKKVNEILR
ncbi:tetratricopeptide repeat protein [Candidatus Woesearchaeota archaeon]|nr:tetratricopeptide repeat protein [Candidatus Woesearchaeota archaeon]